jgi:hypothetical protein
VKLSCASLARSSPMCMARACAPTARMNSSTQMSPLPASNAGGRAPLTIAAAACGTVSTRIERWGGIGDDPSTQLWALACENGGGAISRLTGAWAAARLRTSQGGGCHKEGHGHMLRLESMIWWGIGS